MWLGWMSRLPLPGWVTPWGYGTMWIVSNLIVYRYYVAGLDEQAPHYLGHAMRFWNQVYNWGDAGYALNRPALDKLFTKFPTQVCVGASIADPRFNESGSCSNVVWYKFGSIGSINATRSIWIRIPSRSRYATQPVSRIRIRDPVLFYHYIQDGKNPDLGSRMNISDNFSKSLETIFRVKNTYILWCESGIRNYFDRGSGIQDGKLGIQDLRSATLTLT